MSKLDIARGMSRDLSREREQGSRNPDRDLSEAEILEMRLSLLQQQDMEKLRSNAELMKTLRDLHGLIKEATLSLKRSTQEVKDFPAEAISRGTARIEQTVRECLETAQKAREVYGEAKRLVGMAEKHHVILIFLASMLSSSMTALLQLWMQRR